MTMRKIFVYAYLCFAAVTFAQNITTCEKTASLVFEAINIKNTSKIEPFLAQDFTIAEQKGKIATLVLQKLATQLQDSIVDYKKINSELTENLSLTYEVIYKNKGLKTSKIIFNKDNQILEIELLKMSVKTMKNDALNVVFPDKDFIQLPIIKLGNLIAIEVVLDDVKRIFLLDNGSPKLVLNSKYIKSIANETTISSVSGVNGAISGMNISKINKLEFGGIKIQDQEALTMNLEHLETNFETKIYGLLGYEVYKNYDLFFDYKANTITLIKPSFSRTFLDLNFKNNKKFESPIEMTSHIATIVAKINQRPYKIGIDCGAETNLINEKLYEEFKPNLSKLKTDDLLGADAKSKKVSKGTIDKLTIGGLVFKNTKTVFSDISHLNKSYKIELDGLCGYEILSKQKTLLSYTNKYLTLIN